MASTVPVLRDLRFAVSGFAILLGLAVIAACASVPPGTSRAVERCEIGLTIADGRVTAARYMAAMEGFARQAGTTGGVGQRLWRVTNAKDDRRSPPEGSLRHAIAGARAAGGGYILFDLPADERELVLAAPLRPGSNVTLDGGCSQPRIIDPSAGSAFYLAGVANLVLTGFAITQTGFEDLEESGDCVTVRGGADRIWFAFMALSACRDGMIDITGSEGRGQGRFTISDSRFSEHDKVMLIDGGGASGESCFALPDKPLQVQLSVLRNSFTEVAQRIPRVSGSAYVHFYGNDVAFAPRQRASGAWSGAYGSLVTQGGRLLVERNRYRSPDSARRYRATASQALERADAPGCAADGALRGVANDVGEGLSVQDMRVEEVPSPTYTLAESATAWGRERAPGHALRGGPFIQP
ncbi:hypothetical protein [Alteraurantiacibacter aquimixticola]|uniref:Pectate lyase domain-containing protein n=1 Tax=Alteraurantiacibacter aquimixticola TaxID=2489173 RepID=A0A4T3F0Y2_9SPHN|nr:hypothetical protein [Alteraurantiacibacter aquimixticola]TIX50702.1 hypothetical protein E5222_10660 [Alteraurantiacibacter aquimixticola]